MTVKLKPYLIGFFFLLLYFSLPALASANACLSNATGNWSEAGTWTDCGATTPQSADTVQIQNTHTVTLNTSPTVTSVTIDNGGTLTEDGGSRTLTVSGGWTNNGTFTPNTSLVKFNATQTITGGTTFNNLEFTRPSGVAKTFTISSGTYATTTGTLTLSGGGLFINTGNIDAQGNVTVTQTSTTGGGTATITVLGTGDQILTGSGEVGTGLLPNIVIDKPSGTLTLASIISVDGSGALWTYVRGTVDATTNDSTVIFVDVGTIDGQGTSATMAFDNVQFGNGVATDTFTLGGNLDLDGNLTVSSLATLTASGSNYNVNVAGNWTNSGTYTSGTNTTTFDGSGNSTISGTNTFNNLTSTTAGKTLIFPADTTTTVSGTLTLEGASGNNLVLKSSAAGTDGQKEGDEFTLSVATVGTLNYLTVYDSIATGAASPLSPTNSTNGGNTTDWGLNTTPTISDLGPSGLVTGSLTTDPTPTLTFTTADADADTVAYELTIASNSSFNSPTYQATTSTYAAPGAVSTTTVTLPDGSYYWRVLVGDGQATSSYSTANGGAVAFILDATPPTAGTLSYDSVSTTALTATTTGAADATSGLTTTPYYYRNTTLDTYATATATPATFSGLTPNTAYTYEAGVLDNAGNWATTTAVATTTLANPPATLTLTVDSDTQITASWQANGNPGTTEYYVENSTNSTNSGWQTALTYQDTALTAATAYTYTVKARNAAGAETATITDSATTNAAAVAETPVSTGTVSGGSTRAGRERRLAERQPLAQTPLTRQGTGAGWPTTPWWQEIAEIIPVLSPPPSSTLPTPSSLPPLPPDTPPDDLAPLPAHLRLLSARFPKIAKLFAELGVTSANELDRLEGARLTLPGLSEIAGQTPPDTLFARLPLRSPEASATGQAPLDFPLTVTIGEDGLLNQSLSLLAGQPLSLSLRPDQPAKTIRGYLVLDNKLATKEQKLAYGKTNRQLAALAALDLPPTPSLLKEGEPGTVESRLVLAQFDFLDPDQDGLYEAKTQAPQVPGTYEVITIIDYLSIQLGRKELRLTAVVDPEGYVYEENGGKETRIPEATVTLFWRDPSGTLVSWPAADYQQSNPQVTDKSGTYSFLVPPGNYYLTVQAPGYEPYRGEIFTVTVGRGIHQNIKLKPALTAFGWLDWKLGLIVLLLAALLGSLIMVRLRKHV